MCETRSVLLPLLDVGQALLVDSLFVAWREEEEEAGDVDVPQPVGPGHEGPCVLQGRAEVLEGLESDDCYGGGKCEQHQEPESPDSARGHVGVRGERPPDHYAEEEEVEAGGDACEIDENEIESVVVVKRMEWVM